MRVVCASIPGPGHAYPMLAVARALGERGHDVVVASGSRHSEDAARAGASFVALPSSVGSPLHALRPYEDAAAAAEAFLESLEGLDPEVVVHDVITMGPALAAERIGAPTATLVIHGLHTPSRDLPPFGWARAAGRTPFGRWRDSWLRSYALRDLDRARSDLNAARARLGLGSTERLDGQLSAELVLVATIPSLELPRSDWPAKAHVVGPCLWDAGGPRAQVPSGSGPLALIAASTAHDQRLLLTEAIAAVGSEGVRAIVTSGAADVPEGLPEGVVAVGFASHDSLLESVSVVVCNGGHGIVARSLAAGVPVVVVPGPGDQKENAFRVQRAGAGLFVREPRRRALARAIRRVLDEPSFGDRARAIRRECEAIDGPRRAAELIEALVARERQRR